MSNSGRTRFLMPPTTHVGDRGMQTQVCSVHWLKVQHLNQSLSPGCSLTLLIHEQRNSSARNYLQPRIFKSNLNCAQQHINSLTLLCDNFRQVGFVLSSVPVCLLARLGKTIKPIFKNGPHTGRHFRLVFHKWEILPYAFMTSVLWHCWLLVG